MSRTPRVIVVFMCFLGLAAPIQGSQIAPRPQPKTPTAVSQSQPMLLIDGTATAPFPEHMDCGAGQQAANDAAKARTTRIAEDVGHSIGVQTAVRTVREIKDFPNVEQHCKVAAGSVLGGHVFLGSALRGNATAPEHAAADAFGSDATTDFEPMFGQGIVRTAGMSPTFSITGQAALAIDYDGTVFTVRNLSANQADAAKARLLRAGVDAAKIRVQSTALNAVGIGAPVRENLVYQIRVDVARKTLSDETVIGALGSFSGPTAAVELAHYARSCEAANKRLIAAEIHNAWERARIIAQRLRIRLGPVEAINAFPPSYPAMQCADADAFEPFAPATQRVRGTAQPPLLTGTSVVTFSFTGSPTFESKPEAIPFVLPLHFPGYRLSRLPIEHDDGNVPSSEVEGFASVVLRPSGAHVIVNISPDNAHAFRTITPADVQPDISAIAATGSVDETSVIEQPGLSGARGVTVDMRLVHFDPDRLSAALRATATHAIGYPGVTLTYTSDTCQQAEADVAVGALRDAWAQAHGRNVRSIDISNFDSVEGVCGRKSAMTQADNSFGLNGSKPIPAAVRLATRAVIRYDAAVPSPR